MIASRRIPAEVWQRVEAVHARLGSTLPATEDGAREFMEITIGQIVHDFPGEGYCWKRADPNRPPSKDCLAKVEGGDFFGWDLLSGAGFQGPRELVRDPVFVDLTGQVPVLVEARDFLGTGGGGGEEGNGEEEPGGGESLAELRALVNVLVGKVDRLEQSAVRHGSRIGLKCVQNARYLCADFKRGGQRPEEEGAEGPVFANRDGRGSYETFEVDRES